MGGGHINKSQTGDCDTIAGGGGDKQVPRHGQAYAVMSFCQAGWRA